MCGALSCRTMNKGSSNDHSSNFSLWTIIQRTRRSVAMKSRRNSLALTASVLCVVAACCSVNGAPVVQDKSQATLYLATFGYLSAPEENSNASAPHAVAALPDQDFKKAVQDFQSFAGIKKTGILDAETLRYMNENRCGLSDKMSLPGYQWPSKDLTYRISRYSEQMRKSDIDREIARAFNVWSEVTDLTFTPKTSGPVNIDIGFHAGMHANEGPHNAFDGRGGVLAHAFYPQTGNTHFDATEQWVFNTSQGIDLFQVAAHEFGHALGLNHMDVRESLMAPFFKGYEPHMRLHTKDVEAIQRLYGGKTQGSPTITTLVRPTPPSQTPPRPTPARPTPARPTPALHIPARPTPPPHTTPPIHSTTPRCVTTPKSDEELCRGATFDTIFTTKQNVTYVFKGDKYWELSRTGIVAGYPRPISKSWVGLPGNIDAAFTYGNGKTYFFKGSQYWRYTDMHMDAGYPRHIADAAGFPGIPDNINTAFSMHGRKEMYFFKDTLFWKFHPMEEPHVSAAYPRLITTMWPGLPATINSGLLYKDRHVYIFTGAYYYRVDDTTLEVVADDPPYPRHVGKFWFGCPDVSRHPGTGDHASRTLDYP